MRKLIYLLYIILLVCGIVACSAGDKKQAATNEQLEDLNLHVLAVHEDIELDEYYTELYESVKHTIKEYPKMGQQGEFTLQPYRIVENHQGPYYVFLGINRQSKAIKNISFNLTVGDEEGNLILDEDTIFLSEEEVGTIPSNNTLPILIPVTKDIIKNAKKTDFKQLNMDMTGLMFEEVEE